MPNLLEDRVLGIVIGDTLEIRRLLHNMPPGQSVVSAQLGIRPSLLESMLVTKTITTTDQPGVGWIEDDGGLSAIANLRFDLTSIDTGRCRGGVSYLLGIQITTNIGDVYTPDVGVIRFLDNPFA